MNNNSQNKFQNFKYAFKKKKNKNSRIELVQRDFIDLNNRHPPFRTVRPISSVSDLEHCSAVQRILHYARQVQNFCH